MIQGGAVPEDPNDFSGTNRQEEWAGMEKTERNAEGEGRRETRKEKTEINAEGEGRRETRGGGGKETFRKRNPEQISRPAPD